MLDRGKKPYQYNKLPYALSNKALTSHIVRIIVEL
jgi:hypothetical protein